MTTRKRRRCRQNGSRNANAVLLSIESHRTSLSLHSTYHSQSLYKYLTTSLVNLLYTLQPRVLANQENLCTGKLEGSLLLWEQHLLKMLPHDGKQNTLKTIGQNLSFQSTEHQSLNTTLLDNSLHYLWVCQCLF